MSFFEKVGAVGALAFLVLVLAVAYGWCVNLYQLIVTASAFDATTNVAFLLLRFVGLFVFPLGGGLGLFF